MKKTLSVLLLVVILASLSMTTAFAATGIEYTSLSGVIEKYSDGKTGVEFSAPEEWAVNFTAVRHGATGNGTSYTSRNITIFTGNELIKIQQLGKEKAFVISLQNSGETYYMSEKESMICLDGWESFADPNNTSSWAIERRAIEAVLSSIQFSKTTK